MDGSEYLYTCAEVSVALAGFSALVVAIGDRGDSRFGPLVQNLVTTLIERSLVAAFFSFIPVLLEGLGLAPSTLWFICSGGLGAYIGFLPVRSARRRRIAPEQSAFVSGPLFGVLVVIGAAVAVLQFLNAVGFVLQQGVWFYLVGLTFLISTVAYLFLFAIRYWSENS